MASGGYLSLVRLWTPIVMGGTIALVACGASTPSYDRDAVGRSVAGALGVRSFYRCAEERDALICEMRGKGLAAYVVRRTDGVCWRARRRSIAGSGARAGAWPRAVSGCLSKRDASNGAQPYD